MGLCSFVKKLLFTNLIFDYYISLIEKHLVTSKPRSLTKYIILFSFVVLILKDIHCLRVDAHDMETRLRLFDVSLFLGGIRHYTIYMLLLAYLLTAHLFKTFHLNPDKSQFTWTQIMNYLRGSTILDQIVSVTITEEKDKMFKLVARITYLVTIIFGFAFSKC